MLFYSSLIILSTSIISDISNNYFFLSELMEEIRYLLCTVAEALNHALPGIIISSPMLLWLYTTNMITSNIL